MIGWIIFAVVLALLFLFLLSGVRVEFRYENTEVFLQIRWLFLRYQLLPERKKQAKTKKRKRVKKRRKNPPAASPEAAERDAEDPAETPPTAIQQSGEKKEEAPSRQSRDLQEMFRMVWELMQSAKKPLKLLYRHLWVQRLNLQLVIAREDAAQTAIAYGQMNGWVHGAWAAISHLVRMKNSRVQVLADYLSTGDRLHLSFELRLRVAFLLGAGICFIWNFLWKQMKKGSRSPSAF